MSFWKKIIDAVKGNEDLSDIKSSTLRDILNGNILSKKFIRKQYTLLLLIAVLLVFYIDNRYSSEKQVSEEVKLKKELQDIKYESLTISAELTKLSRRTFVLDYINAKGLPLKESQTAPVSIQEPDPKKDEATKKAVEEHKAVTSKIKNDSTHVEE